MFWLNGAVARAAFVVEKGKQFAERVGAGGVPEKSAGAAHTNEADLAELFEMVRESGSGDVESVLNFAGDHSGGVSREEQADNLQARLGTKSGEAVGRACDEEGIRLGHISMFAEIQ